MRGKIISAIFQLLTLSAVCNEVESDVCIGEVEQLYKKYLSDRKYVVNNLHEVMHKSPNVIFMDFEIPNKQTVYCFGISSNMVVSAAVNRQSAVFRTFYKDPDAYKMIDSFVMLFSKYKYQFLSLTTGPKYVYVTVGNPNAIKCSKFDYPWWISEKCNENPLGMLIGLDENTVQICKLFSFIFGYYVFPYLTSCESDRMRLDEKRERLVQRLVKTHSSDN